MGRHLLRRQTLKLAALTLIFLLPFAAAADTSSPAGGQGTRRPQRERKPAAGETTEFLGSRQTHAGPEVFSLDLELNAPVREEIRRLSTPGAMKWIAASLERSRMWENLIRAKIREYGLPEELFYLPVIESTYQISAVSKSGAVGLWQFMANSIAPFDMHITEWLDERRDFWKSTDASLKKLKENYDYFGDWLLALGAYNCGLGRMSRTVARTGIRDFWTLAAKGYLPPETAKYVPKFLAVAYLASYAGRNGIDLAWPEPLEWERIPLERSVDLSILAETAGIPAEMLKNGNAELKYGITPPDMSGYYLKVPVAYAESVRNVLADGSRKLLRFNLHTVQSGDTLSQIARHFGVSIRMILRYNRGVKPDVLRVGQQLIVPSIKTTEPYVRKIDVEELASFTGLYTVQQGDTLWNIAKRHGTTPEKIAAANDMELDVIIRAGMTLNVPEN